MNNDENSISNLFDSNFELKSAKVEDSLTNKLARTSATLKDLLNYIRYENLPLSEFHTEHSVALEFNLPEDELQNFFFTLHDLKDQSSIAELPSLELLAQRLKKTSNVNYNWQIIEVKSLLKAYQYTYQNKELGITAYALLNSSKNVLVAN